MLTCECSYVCVCLCNDSTPKHDYIWLVKEKAQLTDPCYNKSFIQCLADIS